MAEKWRWVCGYRGRYKVSTRGRVKSVARFIRNGKYFVPDRIRIQFLMGQGKGRLYVQLWKRNRARTCQVSRLVAKAFIPNPENKPEVNHKNGIGTDNRVSNLEWNTRRENEDHALVNGFKPKGSKCGMSKLTERDIPVIRRRLLTGESCSQIAPDYHVSPGTIGFIRDGKTWGHVL